MQIRHVLLRAIAAPLAIVTFTVVTSASAQSSSLTGKVTRDNGDAMNAAIVAIEELRRETRTANDGTYRFENVPPGSYHIMVRAEGYTTPRTEVIVSATGCRNRSTPRSAPRSRMNRAWRCDRSGVDPRVP
jgi:hypothetical protein